MKLKIKNELQYKKTIVALSVLTVVLGAVSALVGDIGLPFVVAPLAVLMLLDSRSKRIVTSSVSTLVLASNVLITYFVNGVWSPLGIEIVLVAFIIAYTYTIGMSKAGSAAICTAVISVFVVLTMALVAVSAVGEFSVYAVKEFYSGVYNELRVTFVKGVMEMMQSASSGTSEPLLSENDVLAMFESISYLMISLVVVYSFFVAGLCYKIFTAVSCKCSREPREVLEWRFITPSLFAYFYIALMLVNLFAGASTDTLAITVANLYNIFMFVYAYVGFNFAYAMLSTRRSPAFAWLVLILGVALFASFAVQLLSMFGLMFTLYYNKTHVSGASGGADQS